MIIRREADTVILAADEVRRLAAETVRPDHARGSRVELLVLVLALLFAAMLALV